MAEKTVDSRVRRTKKLLRQGITELMKQKSIKKITVRELSELVDINRGTFYLHYKDIYDLVEHIENELFEEFEKILLSYTIEEVSATPTRILTDVCTFLGENRDICSALLGGNGDITFIQKLRDFVRSKYLNEFSEYYHIRDVEDFGLLYAFFESAFIGSARYWLQHPEINRSPEDVANLVSSVFFNGAQAYMSAKEQEN